jgi:release factor glutamine methyltransferase
VTARAPDNLLTRRELLQQLTARFRDAGFESPLADARLLLAHALGIDRLGLHSDPEAVVTAREALLVEDVTRRRLAHEPVSRIVGRRWFYGRPFRVTPATLDPRPDSETIIDAAKTLLAERTRSGPLRILDIGTGTGCLLLTLLAEVPATRGIATDVSPDALAVAVQNARDLGLSGHAEFRLGADFTPADGSFELIVSNPPYIPSAGIAALEPGVRSFDPILALDGGPDGLAVYRRLAHDYFNYISDGWLILEVGHDQASAVSRLFQTSGPGARTPAIRVFNDLGGIARCVAICPRSTTTP